MTEAEYHANKSLSKSAIDLILECPALYKAWIEGVGDEESTSSLSFGGMFHKLTLEPHRFGIEYAVTEHNLSTREGKEFKKEAAGRIICKQPDYESALLMSDAVRDHPQAKYLFKDYDAERAIFWEREGISCKAKPDIVSRISTPEYSARYIADLKTTDSANPAHIRRSIAKYTYYRQAAWYLDGMAAIGEPCDAFLFIFVEKSYPHLVTMCQLDNAALEAGRADCTRAISKLKECRETGLYPCYTQDILTISLPPWAA